MTRRALCSLTAAFLLLLGGACLPSPAGAGAAPGSGAPEPPGERQLRDVQKPDHAGPFSVGYMYESVQPSTKSYSTSVKFFYPAQSAGQNTAANTGGAPYPTVVQLTGFGGDIESMNGVATRMASWGLVIAEFGVNWNDWPNCANISDMNDLLDQLERDNSTSGHRLAGMMDREAFGIHGYSSGGGLCLVDAAFVPRFKAVGSWASAIGNDALDYLATIFWQPVQFQAGQNDPDYNEHAYHGYQVFGPPKSYLEIRGGSHGGPYDYDALISFFLRYLDGVGEYDLYLYGAGAMDDAAGLNYSLRFTLENGSYFPPNMTVSAGNATVFEDAPVDFSCSYDGYLPVGHPKGEFRWDLNSDARIEVSGPYNLTARYSYPQAGFAQATMWYQLGGLRLDANRTASFLVVNLPPAIRTHGNSAAAEDEPLHFTADASDTPSDIPLLSCSWDFGDGTFCATADPDHAFTQAGNYSVKLAVRDDDGELARDQFNVSVRNLPPAAFAGPDITTWKDTEAALTGTGRDTPSDAALLQYRWDFGDGTRSDWSSFPDAAHTYTRSGNFSANLSVRDDDGAQAFCSTAVTVLNAPPAASIRMPQDRASFNKDEEVQFAGAGSDTPSDARSLTFSWDFGDGSSSEWAADPAASHTFTRGGKYSVRLRVQDVDRAMATATVGIIIENAPPAVKLLSPAATGFAEDEKVRFAAEGDDTESDRALLNYTWLIDDESYHGQTVELAFSTAGAHPFSVTVQDPEGATGTAAGAINVKNPAPKLTASVSPLRIVEFENVNYSATVSDTASDLPSLRVAWDFGDGSASRNVSGSHAFTRTGNFSVKVTVTDDEDAMAEESFNVEVQARPQVPPRPPEKPPSSSAPLPLIIGAVCAVIVVGAAVAFVVLRRWRRAL